jgi:hypothetical protein
VLYKATLVIYDPESNGVLLDDTDGCRALPYVEVAVSEPGIVAPVNAAVRERFGLDVITLRYVPTGRSREDDSVDAVFFMEVLEPRDVSAHGGRWVARGEVVGIRFETTHAAHVESFMRAVSGDRQVHPLRAEWAKPGWFRDAAAWIEVTLEGLGYPVAGRVEQVRHWNISSIARVPTVRGDIWFKAVPPFFAHEGALMRVLSESSNRVPKVVAADPSRGWILMEAYSEPHLTDVVRMADALQVLAGLQRDWVRRTDKLIAIDCPDRRLETLPADAVRLLQRRDVRGRIDPARVGELNAALDDLPSLCAALVSFGVPETLMHGDFHRGNVATSGGLTILVDWTDGCVGHPFFDLATALPDGGEDRQTLLSTYLEAWTELASIAQLHDAFAIADCLACLHHAVSYQRIVDGIEPGERWELGGVVHRYGVERFLDKHQVAAEAASRSASGRG